MKTKIIGFCIILLWIFSGAVKSYSAEAAYVQELSTNTETDIVYDAESWYSNGEVKFAINIFDEEWRELNSKEEMLAACQIPVSLLNKLSTYELLKLSEEYPMLGDIYTGNTMEEGFQYVVNSFNGLRALLEREDCLKVVCEEYKNLLIPKEKMITYKECNTEEEKVEYFNEILQNDDLLRKALDDSKASIRCDLLEMIMLDKTTVDNVELLLETITDKADEKENAECFEFTNKSVYLSEMKESMLSKASAYYALETNNNTTTKTLYWRGVAINVIVDDNPSYNTYDEALRAIAYWKNDGVTLVSVGCRESNCHSYAWLTRIFPSSSHKYLLNSVPDGLMKECVKYYKPIKNSIAYKVQHSAVVVDETNMRYENGKYVYDPIVIAKWAGGPVVKGPMSVGNYAMSHDEIYGYYVYNDL
ncbi:MAG: hypothetical protein NC223_00300 [Butyrivibrio sp.]|nr:hypothetical protein [Butyrivibrio sp.]